MQRSPLTRREETILLSELRLASRDGIAIAHSVLGALSFLSLAGVEIDLPPLAWLTEHWSELCLELWTTLLSWLPLEISLGPLTTDSVTLVLLVGIMFLRGHRAGYAGLDKFSFRAQDFFARLVFYGMVLFIVVRLRPAWRGIFDLFIDRLPLLVLGLSCLLLVGYGVYRVYVRLLRRLRVVPRLLARPWLVFAGPLLVLVISAVVPDDLLERPLPDDTTLFAIGFVLVLLQFLMAMAMFFFGTPLALWFVRVTAAMGLAVLALVVLDVAWWVVQGETQAAPPSAVASTVSAAVSVDETYPARGVPVASKTGPLTRDEVKQTLIGWIDALERAGTLGATRTVSRCFDALDADSPVRELDLCLILNLYATETYEPKARYEGVSTPEGLEFFSGDQAWRRTVLGCDALGIEPEPCRKRLIELHGAIQDIWAEVTMERL